MLEFSSHTKFGLATALRDWLWLLSFRNYFFYEMTKMERYY